MVRLFVLVTLLLSMTVAACGQTRQLVLQKKNKNKNAYYKTGDVISFKVADKESKITGQILEIADSSIVCGGFEIDIDDITHLYIDEKTKWWLRYKVEQIGLIAGGGYLLLELLNTGQVSKDVLIVSGTLIGVGLLGKLLIGNKIKIKGLTRLRIIET